jgi:hypothetical protein
MSGRSFTGVRRIATIATTGEVVVRNIVNSNAAYPIPIVGGPLAPACYRVSFCAGALEVTARLKSTDDLDLLVGVLQANSAFFEKAEREVLTLTLVSEDAAPPAAPWLGAPVSAESTGGTS